MLNHDLLFSVPCCFLLDRLIKEATSNVMVDHLQSRVTPWRQYASHVKVRGTLSKMDVKGKNKKKSLELSFHKLFQNTTFRLLGDIGKTSLIQSHNFAFRIDHSMKCISSLQYLPQEPRLASFNSPHGFSNWVSVSLLLHRL